ncbi:MAG: hypothetical protein E7A88_02075 [Dermabacter sp.]|uniref:Uncharacterized protein n=1 Tax=Dermabacter hominis 1368 TaxID=1450519 RepID=A0ABR4SK86_9MICO|nr:hypothetical protein [Dermabacter sp.]KDS93610.1 hypothetical protein DHOM_05725 [Dermabacter hominis 1368]MDU0937307.1 hypothetical protein [Dermabacter sp.]MDU4922945.1 hypothetical protein [Dermabacter sp.]
MGEGMDPAAVERLSELLRFNAESWRHAGQELRTLIGALSWKGPDAEAFANRGHEVSAHLMTVSDMLRQLALALVEQAAEQRRASSVVH